MTIHLKYVHPAYQIGWENLRTAWLLLGLPVRLNVSVHQGMLIYRLPKNGVRISYRQLKKGLRKCNRVLILPEAPLPF